jgi:mannitol/fructose-specific phosphotransferase system IIA component (Ntr-type)
MTMELEKYGNVHPQFYDSVIWREQLSSTEVGKKVVLTHGFPEYAINSQICINILEEPTKWDELPVQLIIMIVMNKEDLNTHAYNLDWLYRCLDNEGVIEELLRCKNTNDVKAILLREYEN